MIVWISQNDFYGYLTFKCWVVKNGRAHLNKSAAFTAGLLKYAISDIQLDNKKNYYQKLMYDLMSPPDIKELKDTAYKNAFS